MFSTLGRIIGAVGAVRHKVYVRSFSRLAPYYLVNEFPKSGGGWLAQMLSDALELPFRRNVPIRFEQSVTHGHFLRPWGLANVVVMWRDPRDTIVSFYHHCYFVNEYNNAPLVSLMKKRLPFSDYNDVSANLPSFIRFLSRGKSKPSFTWPEFAAVWVDRPGVVNVSYEALRADTPSELSRAFEALTGSTLNPSRAVEVAEAHSFVRAKAAAGALRTSRTELSFVREGAVGGWRKHFSSEAEEALIEGGYADAMIRLGYEPSSNR